MALTQGERDLIEALRTKLRSMDYVRLSADTVAEHQARQPSALASLAMENMYLEEAELALRAMLDEERVPGDVDTQIIIEFSHKHMALQAQKRERAAA